MMHAFLQAAVSQGLLRSLDYQFARRLAALVGDEPSLLLAAALVSQRVGEGDVCLDLTDCQRLPLFARSLAVQPVLPPSPGRWVESLQRLSPVVGRPGESTPLILDRHKRLYLGRYWYFENALASALIRRTGHWPERVDTALLRQGLERLFPPAGEIDWQRVAAAIAVLRPFCVISGGPGTGKTRTVTAILALLLEQAGSRLLRLALAAPTGKAAARLSESIRAAKTGLPLPAAVADAIPEEAVTLHRLLGFRPGRANPRYTAGNPLHLDVVVVDEASMVDLPLMARLFQALPASARVILLGDQDQLASVEAGMVLGDICGRGAATRYSDQLCAELRDATGVELAFLPGTPVADHLVVLRKSWRFATDSGIGALARAVNQGDPQAAVALLQDRARLDLEWCPSSLEELDRLIESSVVPAYRAVLVAADPPSAFMAFNRLRVLCAVRQGALGVAAVNTRIEQHLSDVGLIQTSDQMYTGRPVLVTSNDHGQRLYNGDLGLVLPDPQSAGANRVFFETADGVRRVSPLRLPPHETVYAMTVHKSQGSEFDRVILILPDIESRVISRELVYTAVTRARCQVTLLADRSRLEAAIRSPSRRTTGLHDALWEAP